MPDIPYCTTAITSREPVDLLSGSDDADGSPFFPHASSAQRAQWQEPPPVVARID